jgi:hypothetical protein
MAKQVIGIGSAANDGTGDPLRTAFDKINDNFTELYSDDVGDVNSVNGATGTVVLDSDDIAEGTTNEYYTEAKVSANTSVTANTAKVTNATHTGDVTGATALTIANDVIDFDKLGAEFTTSSAVTTALDFSAAQVFTKTMTADTTFTYSNVGIGMVKDFILTGAFVPTFPSGTKTVAGTYDGSVSNLIQIVAVASGDYWMSISKAQ